MKHIQNVITAASVVALLIFGLACSKKTEDAGSTAGGGGGGTALFTATDIEKSWTSSCATGSDPITGGQSYKTSIYFFSGGNFNSSQTWYSGSACGFATEIVSYESNGTYTVGGATTGGQTITFTITGAGVMPLSAANTAQYASTTALIADCSTMTPTLSPAGTNRNGNHFSYYMAICNHMTTPNSASNKIVTNVATYSNSTLTIGIPYNGVPGVFSGMTVPASATLQLF